VPGAGQNNHPRLVILSVGYHEVDNPAYDGNLPNPKDTRKKIIRDFGFGSTNGTVKLGAVNLPILQWNNGMIVVRVPPAAALGGLFGAQLMVTRGDNANTTIMGVTVTVGPLLNGHKPLLVGPGESIQAAMDRAVTGDLILVSPGTRNELVIMNKKVKLQGWGAPSTIINAVKSPSEKMHLWRIKVGALYNNGLGFTLVPGQELGFDAPNNEPTLFTVDEGAGITVVALSVPNGRDNFVEFDNARIDGITVTGSDGGGIFVSGHAQFLEISNNKVVGNYGVYGGGIRVGHLTLLDTVEPNIRGGYSNSNNDKVNIHNNHVSQNGSSEATGAGAGVAICNGTDGYAVADNYVCGNFSAGNGGGIGHMGRSNNGKILRNTVLFNQSFNQGATVSGGGIFVGGQAALTPGGLSPGSGDVTIARNLVQGNQAGAGDGGGIRLEMVNGLDVTPPYRNNPNHWYEITVVNNMIVNNMTGLAGGGISIQDAIKTNISNNTVANNDSTATAGGAFRAGSPNQSSPQPAGIVSRALTTLLYNTIGNQPEAAPYKKEWSDPVLVNNIIWHNRSFYWKVDDTLPIPYSLLPAPNAAVYSDLAVLGTSLQGTFPQFTNGASHRLDPRFSILTSKVGYKASNLDLDPLFQIEYLNGSPGQTIQKPEITTTLVTAAAFDEGGNFIDVRFGPLSPTRPCPATPPALPVGFCKTGDYHLLGTSPALNQGIAAINAIKFDAPENDFDGQGRPRGPDSPNPDIGADERGDNGAP
jgi:hypothetical protein